MAGGKWETAFSLDLVIFLFHSDRGTQTLFSTTFPNHPYLTASLWRRKRQLQSTVTWRDTHLQSLCRAQGWCPHNIAWSCLLSLSPGLTATVIANRMSLLEVWLLRGERAPSAISILDVRSVISLVPCHLLSQKVSGCNYSAWVSWILGLPSSFYPKARKWLGETSEILKLLLSEHFKVQLVFCKCPYWILSTPLVIPKHL